MSMTLADMRRRVNLHLRRPATRYNGSAWVAAPVDTSLDPADVTAAINTATANVWREAGGPTPDTVRVSLVANQRDYALPAPFEYLLSASVIDTGSNSNLPRPLKRAADTALPGLYADYPDTPTAGSYPVWYTVRPLNTAGTSGAVVSLYPAPTAGVSYGLVLQAGAGAAELVNDADVSYLPDVVNGAACWLAAYELGIGLSDDPRIERILPALDRSYRSAQQDAVWYVAEMGGKLQSLVPTDNFGPQCYRPRWLDYSGYGTGTTETTMYFRSSIVTAAGGETAITCDTSSAPGIAGSDPMVDGENQGRIFGVTWNGGLTQITATFRTNPDTGTPFTADAGERFLFNWFSGALT